MIEQKTILAEGLMALGLAISDEVAQKLLAYVHLLDKWNRVYNLTAIRDQEEMIYHHVLDSLAVLSHLPKETKRILDVGSGGGMPGMLLAILNPEWQVVLLDSNQKKTAFLQQAVIELALKNVEVVLTRVESYEPLVKFDVITARAFSELGLLLKLTRHLISENGLYAALKGVFPKEEIAQLPNDVIVEEVIALNVPQIKAERHLVKMRINR